MFSLRCVRHKMPARKGSGHHHLDLWHLIPSNGRHNAFSQPSLLHVYSTTEGGTSCKSSHSHAHGSQSACGNQAGHQAGHQAQKALPPMTSPGFWAEASAWRRAGVNTLRCLVGCTSGDFAAMWFLQAYYPDLGVGATMAISMASGLATSMLLETALLRLGRDALPSWRVAARTAAGMSLVSMLAMEAAENAVDYQLTGGAVALDSPAFWAAAAVAAAAGFLAPLPYNYVRLRRFGRACH